MTETIPNNTSCVVLTNQKDKNGLLKARLNWQLKEIDKKTFSKHVDKIINYFKNYNDIDFIPENWITNNIMIGINILIKMITTGITWEQQGCLTIRTMV